MLKYFYRINSLVSYAFNCFTDVKAPEVNLDDRESDDEFNQQQTHEVTVHSDNKSHNDGRGLIEGQPTSISNNNDQPITKHAVAVSRSSTTDFSPGEDVYQCE